MGVPILRPSAIWSDDHQKRLSRYVFAADRAFWQLLRWLVVGLSRLVPAKRRAFFGPLQSAARQRLRFAKLAPSETFWTTVILPSRLSRERDAALERQIANLSPLPPGEVQYALGGTRAPVLGTVETALCLTTDKTLDAIERPIAMAVSSGQRAYFVSPSYLPAVIHRLFESRIVQGVVICLSLVLSISIYGNRAASAYEREQDRLTQAIRELRVESTILSELTDGSNVVRRSDLLDFLHNTDGTSDIVLVRLNLSSAQHQAEGFIGRSGAQPTGVTVLPQAALPPRGRYKPVRWVSDPTDG